MTRGYVHLAWPPHPNTPSEAPTFTTVSHESLFSHNEKAACSSCGDVIAPVDDDTADPGGSDFAVAGEGVWLRARGEAVEIERSPVCSTCAVAIGVTVAQRSIIEEEEG